MKVFSFSGGLGNQMFGFAFYSYMKEKYPDHKMFGHYNKGKLSEHYGLEINKWFDVYLPQSTWYSTLVVAVAFVLKRLFHITRFIETNQRLCENENAVVFYAFKYSKQYLPSDRNWLRWKVDDNQLSRENAETLSQIKSTNSWFIHVRRGDYLSDTFKDRFAGCCPLSYYEKAINDILHKETNPVFYCFSDDLEWAKNNLPKTNIVFVEGNTGTDSPLDMYLMSNCKGAIIANSSFSYWGAYLGVKKKRVYYPERWINTEVPDIFFEDWIKY